MNDSHPEMELVLVSSRGYPKEFYFIPGRHLGTWRLLPEDAPVPNWAWPIDADRTGVAWEKWRAEHV